MNATALSLQQLQVYRPQPVQGGYEVVCVMFLLSEPVCITELRQAASKVLEQARIAVPDRTNYSECVVEASNAALHVDACAHAAAVRLLELGSPCRLEVSVAPKNGEICLLACGLPWIFDSDGLARFVERTLEYAMGVPNRGTENSYADYVRWQRELVASPEAQFGRQYWLRRSKSVKPIAELGLEEKFDVAVPSAASLKARQLPDEMRLLLNDNAARYGVTLDAMVLAAWLIVLESLHPAQRKDLVVMSTDCDDDLFADVLGRLAFELPLSFQLPGHDPFIAVVKNVCEQIKEVEEWKECLPEQHLLTDSTRHALRFSKRVLHAGSVGNLTWREQLCTPFNPTCRLELMFLSGQQPALALFGDPAVHSDTTLCFLLESCEAALKRALADPLASVNKLICADMPEPVASPTLITDAAPALAGELIEAALTLYVDRIALCHAGGSLTYGELAQRVNARANDLAQSGCGTEQALGITTGDFLEYMVSALAAWRVGAHFVSVDADLPSTRIARILKTTDVQTLVDMRGVRSLGKSVGLVAHAPTRACIHPESLAYVVYTSGTSGEPRAVAISHRALANQLAALARQLSLEPGARALVRTPPTFDASIWEWLYPLVCGATLHVLGQEDAFTESAIIDVVNKQNIDIAQMTPSLLRRCLNASGAETLSTLRHLVIGGEPLNADLVAPIIRRGGTLVNAYGPAETCINASMYRVTEDRHRRTAPIGGPLDGYAFHIVDARLRPVPTGRSGILCIGGESLARCLLGASAATAATFVPDPFSAIAGARMYVTGDMVRRLPNGDIEFLGRIDDQIKLNGVRMDSVEIVAAMKSVDRVKDAALVLLEGASPTLIGCVVPAEPNHFSPDALRKAVRMKLPSSMCPEKFVVFHALPLNAHGKIDRRALYEYVAAELEVIYVAPRTETERRVAQCWCEVLNVDRVGMDDNFFLSGGHSLSFARLIVKLREAFGINIPLSRVISASSVAALARHIDEQRDTLTGRHAGA